MKLLLHKLFRNALCATPHRAFLLTRGCMETTIMMMRHWHYILLLALVPGVLLAVDFGDNSSQWANDGECDDPRFAGPGMTDTALLDSDRGRDANDCRRAWEAGNLWLANSKPAASNKINIDFGDNASEWANDGECDDPRFIGPGMTNTVLLDSDRGHDANDCRQAWEAGRLQLR